MPGPWQLLPLLLAQQAGRQRLARVAEPSQVTDAAENVVQYDRVMGTKLVLAYAAGLQTVHRARSHTTGGPAADLACGPGHYTLCLARYLGYTEVTGVDLSPGMVEAATRNAAGQGLADRVRFRQGDVTRLDAFPGASLDLASCTDAAHHLPDLETVGRMLAEMDRVTRPEGLVMLMDLARLRTDRITRRYVELLGHDYVARGLPAFLDDFRNSMYAAWTAAELHRAIPAGSARWWCHLVPRGLPTLQIILGLPAGRRRLYVRSGVPWPAERSPVPADMRAEWRIVRLSLRFASRRWVPPGAGNGYIQGG